MAGPPCSSGKRAVDNGGNIGYDVTPMSSMLSGVVHQHQHGIAVRNSNGTDKILLMAGQVSALVIQSLVFARCRGGVLIAARREANEQDHNVGNLDSGDCHVKASNEGAITFQGVARRPCGMGRDIAAWCHLYDVPPAGQ